LIETNRYRVDLLKEMGQTGFAEVVLTEPLTLDTVFTPEGIEQALGQRIEIKAARAALHQSVAVARLQEVNARPDLNVTAGYKRTELPDTTYGVNTAIVSVRMTLPITGKNQGNRIAADAEVRRQQQLVAAAEAAVRGDYAGALQEYELQRGFSIPRRWRDLGHPVCHDRPAVGSDRPGFLVRQFPEHPSLRPTAIALGGIAAVQVFLGSPLS
jgi:outer membrane efflux protein